MSNKCKLGLARRMYELTSTRRGHHTIALDPSEQPHKSNLNNLLFALRQDARIHTHRQMHLPLCSSSHSWILAGIVSCPVVCFRSVRHVCHPSFSMSNYDAETRRILYLPMHRCHPWHRYCSSQLC